MNYCRTFCSLWSTRALCLTLCVSWLASGAICHLVTQSRCYQGVRHSISFHPVPQNPCAHSWGNWQEPLPIIPQHQGDFLSGKTEVYTWTHAERRAAVNLPRESQLRRGFNHPYSERGSSGQSYKERGQDRGRLIQRRDCNGRRKEGWEIQKGKEGIKWREGRGEELVKVHLWERKERENTETKRQKSKDVFDRGTGRCSSLSS